MFTLLRHLSPAALVWRCVARALPGRARTTDALFQPAQPPFSAERTCSDSVAVKRGSRGRLFSGNKLHTNRQGDRREDEEEEEAGRGGQSRLAVWRGRRRWRAGRGVASGCLRRARPSSPSSGGQDNSLFIESRYTVGVARPEFVFQSPEALAARASSGLQPAGTPRGSFRSSPRSGTARRCRTRNRGSARPVRGLARMSGAMARTTARRGAGGAARWRHLNRSHRAIRSLDLQHLCCLCSACAHPDHNERWLAEERT